ncbi:hypothetical protein [Occultella gossypii]|uniref:Lipoprotein n=1 Tax=Occultella gossypii TaxID=2800820 RepID=A0ABS7SH81_9MICO|nr:hypothetical protein [Occultella gossypii]MBZ2199714.1 hypothetical protein [Occultella gossypii]
MLLTLAACSSAAPEAQEPAGLAYEGGSISEAEYVALVSAVRQCMVDKGYDVDPVEMRDDDLTYGFSIGGGQVGDTSSGQDLAACEQPLNFADAEIAFQEQNVLTGAEREQVMAEFITCLDDAGVPGITEQDSLEEITQRMVELEESGGDVQPAMACTNQYASRIFGAGR